MKHTNMLKISIEILRCMCQWHMREIVKQGSG